MADLESTVIEATIESNAAVDVEISTGPTIEVDIIGSGPQGPQGIQGPQGEQGIQGPAGADGADGQDGQDGVSPVVSSESITGGHRITIVDAGGTTVVDVMDGTDGQDGQDGQDGTNGTNGTDGQDGVSPEVSIASITGGHSVTITDADHPTGQTFNVMDGADGQNGSDGADGADGVSPGVTIASITGGHSVTITDADHPGGQSFNVMDGEDGQNGQNGAAAGFGTPTATIDANVGTPSVTVSASGPDTAKVFSFSFSNMKGATGSTGPAGPGVPTGGVAGQVLYKKSATNYDAEWSAPRIPYGALDNTSTSTVMTATVPGITELKSGVCMWLTNGVVSSASGVTININNLGAKPVYKSQAAATAIGGEFASTYTVLFVYNESRVYNGCWDYVYGFDSDKDTTGYYIRTCAMALPMKSQTYRYRLLFTSADGAGYVPANNSTSTNSTTSRTPCQDPIDPFGRIVYYGTTAIVSTGSSPNIAYQFQQYAGITIGYSFTGITLTANAPLYLKCAPQSNGSAIIDSTTPIVQALPSTDDGKIYIFLGVATSSSQFELVLEHPVYYYKDSAIRQWTNPTAGGAVSSVDGKTGAVTILPTGGNAGQLLAKNSATDYDVHWVNKTQDYPSAYCTTAAATAAKKASCSLWMDTANSYLHVLIGAANTSASAITLNVNSTGAKPIYINGTASSATNYTLPAGSYLVFYDGTNFYFRTDGKLTADITGHAGGDIALPASPSSGDFLVYNGSAWAAVTMAEWQGGSY